MSARRLWYRRPSCFPPLYGKNKVHASELLNVPVDRLKEYIAKVVKETNRLLVGEVTEIKLNYTDFGNTIVIFKPSDTYKIVFEEDAKDLMYSELSILMKGSVTHLKYNILQLRKRAHTRLIQSPISTGLMSKNAIGSLKMKITQMTIEKHMFITSNFELVEAFTSKDNSKICGACTMLAYLFYGKNELYDKYTSIPEIANFLGKRVDEPGSPPSRGRSRRPGSQSSKFLQFKLKMDTLIADIVADLAAHSGELLPSTADAYCSIIRAYGAARVQATDHEKASNIALKYIMYLTYIDLASKTPRMSDNSLLLRVFIESAGPLALKVMQKFAQVPGLKAAYSTAFKLSYEKNCAITKPEFEYIRNKLVNNPWSNASIKAISSTPLSVASVGQVHLATVEALDSTSSMYDHAIFKMIKPMTMFYLLFESCASGIPITADFLDDDKMEDACRALGESSDAKKYLVYMVFSMIQELNFTNEYQNIKKGLSVYTDHRRGLYTVEAYGVNNDVLPVLIMNIADGESLNAIVVRADTVLRRKMMHVFKELIYRWVFNALLDAKGYMHADLHGGNIFVSPDDGHITIIDFGNFVTITKAVQCYLLNIFLLHNKVRNSRRKAQYVDKIVENIDKLCDTKIQDSCKDALIAFYNSVKKDRLGSMFQIISKHMTSVGSCSAGEVSDFSKGINLLEKSWSTCAGASHMPLIDVFLRELAKRNPRKLLRLLHVSKCET